jgi:2'-5' RNA ligase
VVVAIPDPLATELRRWRRSFGDSLADRIPAHITLVTTTPVADWQGALEHVRAVAGAQLPFTVSIKGTSSFRPVSPVVYLNVDRGFGACVDLHQRLQQGPLARALPFPFHPHVTIAHDIDPGGLDSAEETLSDFEASFEAAGIGLYLHDGSGEWQLQEELTFGGPTH